MAYTATGTSTPTKYAVDGRTYYQWTVTETEAAAGSEFTLDGVPPVGTVVLYKAKLTAGTGTTIQPEIGATASWTDSSINEIGRIASAAAFINDATGLRFHASGGKLYIRSTPNDATGDHAITTQITIAAGAL